MMGRQDLLNAIVDDGETSVRSTYVAIDQRAKLEGSLEGFAGCRMLGDDALLELARSAEAEVEEARREQSPRYVRLRWRQLQIDWVLNVLSAAYHAHGRPPLVAPTARGMAKAADILGVGRTGPD